MKKLVFFFPSGFVLSPPFSSHLIREPLVCLDKINLSEWRWWSLYLALFFLGRFPFWSWHGEKSKSLSKWFETFITGCASYLEEPKSCVTKNGGFLFCFVGSLFSCVLFAFCIEVCVTRSKPFIVCKKKNLHPSIHSGKEQNWMVRQKSIPHLLSNVFSSSSPILCYPPISRFSVYTWIPNDNLIPFNVVCLNWTKIIFLWRMYSPVIQWQVANTSMALAVWIIQHISFTWIYIILKYFMYKFAPFFWHQQFQ